MTDERRPPHFDPGCTCSRAGEDPECPHHGYEAVIARLEAALEKKEKAAFLAGFNASGEGWNGEHPFDGSAAFDDVSDAYKEWRSSLSGGGREGPD